MTEVTAVFFTSLVLLASCSSSSDSYHELYLQDKEGERIANFQLVAPSDNLGTISGGLVLRAEISGEDALTGIVLTRVNLADRPSYFRFSGRVSSHISDAFIGYNGVSEVSESHWLASIAFDRVVVNYDDPHEASVRQLLKVMSSYAICDGVDGICIGFSDAYSGFQFQQLE